ncbi:hypothetical protein [Gemmobacter nectariphilus]|uniref:hypothetical protein n=1 Tax=Gemmobacter nectariphilus TaxID=220343 RepID=UPI0003F97E43|nr:hypothetical protein [Gemmobacter nectariphilus]
MQRPTEGRHIADRRAPAGKARTAAFLRLDRAPRETFHVSRDGAGANRIVQFLRIARGRLA